MSKIDDRLRELEHLSEYKISKYNNGLIRLDRNENFFIPKYFTINLVKKAIENIDPRKYPDEEAILYDALSNFLGIDSDQILIGSGSDDLIYKLSLALINKNDEAIINVPTFTIYKWAIERVGGTVKEVSLNNDFTLNTNGLLEAYNDKTKLIFICSPNNPTGNIFSVTDIRKILENVDCVVIIDEAYYYFSKRSLIKLLNEGFENLIIIRSFSKIGFAGIRLGYIVTSKKIASIIRKFIMPYSISTFSIFVSLEIIKNFNTIQKLIDKHIKERERVYKELRKFEKITVYPSYANFLLVKLIKGDVNILVDALKSKGIIVKDVSSYPLLNNCFRVTIGNINMNNIFLDALGEILHEI